MKNLKQGLKVILFNCIIKYLHLKSDNTNTLIVSQDFGRIQ